MREGMTVANEQDFVREIILNGYVLRNTRSLGDATNNSLMDLWTPLSAIAVLILNPPMLIGSMKPMFCFPSSPMCETRVAITPVHWSIATMIVENQKRKKSYKDKVSRYQERLQRPASKEGTKQTPEEIQRNN